MLTLKTTDGTLVPVPISTLSQFKTIQSLLEEGIADESTIIPLKVPATHIETILKYVQVAKDHPDTTTLGAIRNVADWETNFYSKYDVHYLSDLLLSVLFLEFDAMKVSVAVYIGSLIKNKSVKETYEFLDIPFPREDEAHLFTGEDLDKHTEYYTTEAQ